jgi:isoleucyl-tRNA synthetase
VDGLFGFRQNRLTSFLTAYRLYTVVPRLLDLIDELTNWYIRFNRTRLKGENGHDDTVAALNTLFETLYTLSLTLVSFVRDQWKRKHSCVYTVVLYSLHRREPVPRSPSVRTSSEEP